jgi:hypothetical protein
MILMDRCPCCRARLAGAQSCPRCRADLSMLIAARKAADRHLKQSARYWQQNQVPAALKSLEQASHLHHTPLADALRRFMLACHYQTVSCLLSQRNYLHAKSRLHSIRRLAGHDKRYRLLNAFTDYLLLHRL